MLMKTDTPAGFAREIPPENRRWRAEQGRRLRARPHERPQLQAGRPDQLLHQGDTEKSRRLRSGQTRDRFRPERSGRKRRLLRRQAG